MGSDPQSYLQHQHDSAKAEFFKEFESELRKRFPIAIYSGSEKFDYGDKKASALCQSSAQAEAMIAGMWPDGYWERW